jgi:hypothetical protein
VHVTKCSLTASVDEDSNSCVCYKGSLTASVDEDSSSCTFYKVQPNSKCGRKQQQLCLLQGAAEQQVWTKTATAVQVTRCSLTASMDEDSNSCTEHVTRCSLTASVDEDSKSCVCYKVLPNSKYGRRQQELCLLQGAA